MTVRRVMLHVLVWAGVFACWLVATRQFHPLLSIAVLATMVLVSASAGAVYLNELWLLPVFARRGLCWQYAATLLAAVLVLDVLAVVLIQGVYGWLWHPDPLRFGFWFNVASDGFIIALHLVAARCVVWLVMFLQGRKPSSPGED